MDQDKEEILRGLDLVEEKADSKLKPAFDQVNRSRRKGLIKTDLPNVLENLGDPFRVLTATRPVAEHIITRKRVDQQGPGHLQVFLSQGLLDFFDSFLEHPLLLSINLWRKPPV